MSTDVTYTARWIFPVVEPPLERGLITVRDGRILTVEPAGSRTADVDLGDVAIIPGLGNAHTHLDLSGARGKVPPTPASEFPDWLAAVIAYRQTRSPEQTQADIRLGLAEAMAFGTTMIGDIASGGASWDALATAPIRATVFYELIGLNEKRLNDAWNQSSFVSGSYCFEEDYPRGIVVRPNTERCRWAISPHAPYSVNGELARRMFTLGPAAATHLAESPNEQDLLEHRRGPFVDFLQRLGVYDPTALTPSWREFVSPLVMEPEPWPRPLMIVHGNYLPYDFRFRNCHTLCYCPRTHAAFKHPPHPFAHYLSQGVRVVLGTDSLASNPDLDPLAEARLVHQLHPEISGERLLAMITLSCAESLGLARECGSLEPGKSADLVTIPLLPEEFDDPYECLFSGAKSDLPRRTLFQGEWRL